ncbi:hypothetical protein BD289DRAFT_243086 [Coniella lustricola]|uniref:Uncharacterized protein n=1 Tax=Coniella lustricola TaxID=2025994 RepID=A0A2T3A9H8_9PEZI|nr:hypothetical protein BD289DRAFT_243086 [Coniella lustricola]
MRVLRWPAPPALRLEVWWLKDTILLGQDSESFQQPTESTCLLCRVNLWQPQWGILLLTYPITSTHLPCRVSSPTTRHLTRHPVWQSWVGEPQNRGKQDRLSRTDSAQASQHEHGGLHSPEIRLVTDCPGAVSASAAPSCALCLVCTKPFPNRNPDLCLLCFYVFVLFSSSSAWL